MDLSSPSLSSSSHHHYHSSTLSVALACPSSSPSDAELDVTLQEFRILGQSIAVMEALGSHLTNKYSEGMAGARYYGGDENWGVNVQPYSCTSANLAVYTGLLLPGDRIMGLDMPSRENTSHGCYMQNGRKVSTTSIFVESLMYKVSPQTGYIDYDTLEERALEYRPKILICGGSSYNRIRGSGIMQGLGRLQINVGQF
ncbi:hypothetical protein Pint_33118 [Pistacia integerrima]|uniref:Uncharacterized protein n=1 Tax=Pistacia integerrima TaxID=434235 RepID=A0ACC0X5A0_9ROSI|nr:hypothetical protein Pint_33118 [Pistacia integerrima]